MVRHVQKIVMRCAPLLRITFTLMVIRVVCRLGEPETGLNADVSYSDVLEC